MSSYFASSWERNKFQRTLPAGPRCRFLTGRSPPPPPCARACFVPNPTHPPRFSPAPPLKARGAYRDSGPAAPRPRSAGGTQRSGALPPSPHLDQSQQVGAVLRPRRADAERGHFRRRFPLRPPRLTSPRCVNRRSNCFFIRVPGAAATCGQSGCEHVPAA